MGFFNELIDYLHEKQVIKTRKTHWKARLIVSLTLLTLSTFGVLITAFAPSFAWRFWCYITPVFAILCIFLSWSVARKHAIKKIVIWHEILHWFGLMLAVFVVALIVNDGIISYLLGSIFVLLLLALTLFLAGVHFDSMYIVLGLILGLMAFFAALLIKYITIVLIPLIIVVALFFFWRSMHHRKLTKPSAAAHDEEL
jgi:hypothetical protein